MPKVIHVVRKFEPAAWGGTETHLLAMVRELGKLGWESEVHAPDEAGTDGRILEEAGARFRAFRARYPYLRMSPEKRAGLVAAGGNLVSVHELGRLVRARADMLHLHTLGRLGGVVRTASRLRKIPYAVTLHGPVRAFAEVARDDARSRTQGMIDLGAPFGLLVGARRVAQDADLLYVLNRMEHDAWQSVRKGRHLEQVEHGVDLTLSTEEVRRKARGSIRGLGDAPFVVVIARLDRAKGQDVAVEAFLRSAPQEVHLVLAGSTSDQGFADQVSALAARSQRIHMAGGVSPSTARALLAEAKLALLPSRSEPFGIVLLEAWAEQTPALFSDVGGMTDIARRTQAPWGLVRPDDIEALSARLAEVLGDEDGLRAEGAAVRKRVAENYSWRALAERMVRGYERAGRDRR